MLQPLTQDIFDISFNIVYSTQNNFTNKRIYKNSLCYIHQAALKHLKEAINLAKTIGYQLKIYDAFRPIEAQKILWKALPDENYVSNPYNELSPLTHCRGIAIDLTLNDKQGTELDMGTKIDEMSILSFPTNYQDITDTALQNRLLLRGIMTTAGFEPIDTEWWHFQLPNYSKYPIIKNGTDYVAIV